MCTFFNCHKFMMWLIKTQGRTQCRRVHHYTRYGDGGDVLLSACGLSAFLVNKNINEERVFPLSLIPLLKCVVFSSEFP